MLHQGWQGHYNVDWWDEESLQGQSISRPLPPWAPYACTLPDGHCHINSSAPSHKVIHTTRYCYNLLKLCCTHQHCNYFWACQIFWPFAWDGDCVIWWGDGKQKVQGKVVIDFILWLCTLFPIFIFFRLSIQCQRVLSQCSLNGVILVAMFMSQMPK